MISSCAISLLLLAGRARAQLRPLDPAPFAIFERSRTISASLGASRLADQRASLAGTEGTLTEIANFDLAWRTGRVVIEAGGTGQRYFKEERRFAAAYPDVKAASDGKRHDSGDYRISTSVRLTPDRWPFNGVLRFGTRLPTTDNTTGLDRDAIDFFATAGAGALINGFSLSGEAGLGIHTTREAAFEQDDLFLYALRAEYPWRITPSLIIVAQKHGAEHSEIRGVEDLGEVRLGLRAGHRNWMRLEFVKGYEDFSPSNGFIVTVGILR